MFKTMLSASLVLLAAALPSAQAQVPYPHPHGNVYKRLHDQRARIRQGDRTGELTRRENRRVWRQDRRITAQYHHDLRHDGGHLTAAQRRHLDRELNHASGNIYRDKHNRWERH